ncbi:MAG: hypothetical protein R3F62_13605 [Planctomycetota bacterium]
MERWLLALAPLIGLCVNCTVQPLVQHLRGRGRPAPSLAAGFLAGLGCTLALVAWASRGLAPLDRIGLLAIQGLSSAALGYGYFNFVNLNLASIRIRILKEVAQAGPEGLPTATLAALYDEERLAAGRLERMRAGGHLREEAGRYRGGKQTLVWIARVIELLKHLILGRGSRLRAPAE